MKSDPGTDTNIICESKKHWFTYVVPSFFIFSGLTFLNSEHFPLGIVFLIICIPYVFSLKSKKWTLTKKNLVVQGGFLPWTKYSFHIPIHQIYEALYGKGLFGSIFKYGNLEVRRTEGNTSSFTISRVTNYGKMAGSINFLIEELRKELLNRQGQVSYIDELAKLSELREKGSITETEFKEFKEKILNKS